MRSVQVPSSLTDVQNENLFQCIAFFLPLAAVRRRSYDVVLCLILGGAFVEQVCLRKWTATHEAAKVSGSVSEWLRRKCNCCPPSHKS